MARGVRIGHVGTLDPMATGVLVVAFGAATRVTEWLALDDKEYEAEVTLGSATDTYDATGTEVGGSEPPRDADLIGSALEELQRRTVQTPPRYSAIKVAGQTAYRYARRGAEIHLAPRPVRIDRLALLDWRFPRATVSIACSKGTYVRSIAHDLGILLGCGAHLSALRRMRSGRFAIANASPLARLLQAIRDRKDEGFTISIRHALGDWPSIDVTQDRAAMLRSGVPIAGLPVDPTRSDSLALAVEGGHAIAIVEWRDACWRPRKVLT